MTNSAITQIVTNTKTNTLKKNQYKNFTLVFLSSISLLMLAVGLFNYVIDSYGVFNFFYHPKINDVKRKSYNDHLHKPLDIIRIKPKTVIMGTSKVKQGINPNNIPHEIVPNNNYQYPVYNLGLNGANIYEVKRYLEHTIANSEDLSLVILGLDLTMFDALNDNKITFKEARIGKKHMTIDDIVSLLFSLSSLENSWTTIKNSRKEDMSKDYGANGFFSGRVSKSDDANTRFTKQTAVNIDDFLSHKSKNLTDFQDIVNLCQKHNIQLIVFIPPSHATYWEAIKVAGKWETFEDWKRQIVKINPVIDFSGYNTITTKDIHDGMKDYIESTHYTEKVGNIILERILLDNSPNVPDDFGVLVTSENIESHLAKIRQHRETWTKNHPEQWRLVQEVKQKYKSQLQK